MKIKVFLLWLLCPMLLFGQTWDYPVKPGCGEWKKLDSHKAMVDICQIPNGVLSEIPTEELVELCLDYPLFFTMEAFNNLQEGFLQVSTEFNGFKELFSRQDAGSVLLCSYLKERPEKALYEKDLTSQGLYKQRLFFLEFILSQKIVFSQLDEYETKLLLRETMRKMEEKERLGYSIFNRQVTALIAVRILQTKVGINKGRINLQDPKYQLFSSSVLLSDKDMVGDIKNATNEYLESSN